MELVLLFLIGIGFTVGSDPVVQISNGKVGGKTLKTPNGQSFYAFQGIPYAKPPIGDLRFKPPQRPDDWEGILNNDNANTICIQLSSTQLPNESEDCLFLHVYTPQLPTEKENVSLPVMYVIHGGAFVQGSSIIDEMGPHFLMEYGIIMVAVHYRLGFFGFVSTGDLACPGNNGLKDQQFGLRWVQENIRSFGGDPSRVTIFGQSAGGASVSYQLLGSHSEGLFRAAIQDSGSALATWALQRSPREIAFRIANNIDPSIDESNTTTQLMSFYKTVDVSQVKKACVDIFGEGLIVSFFSTSNGYVLSGVVEPEHDDAFLTEAAFKKFESGKFNAVPTLMGINSEEVLFMNLDLNLQKKMKDRDEKPALLVSPDMHITDESLLTKIGGDIKKIYVGDGLLQENLGPSIKFLSDSSFGKSVLKQAQLQSAYSDVYLYEFRYSGQLGQVKYPTPVIEGAERVNHGEEMDYLFSLSSTVDINKFPERDITTSKRMLTMWTNFVKYMNPTPEPTELLQNTIWQKITSTNQIPYLSIDESLEVKYDLKKTMTEEYHRLYSSYAVPPLYTY